MSVVVRLPAGVLPVFKHAEHDQKDHGKWASGSVSVEIADARERLAAALTGDAAAKFLDDDQAQDESPYESDAEKFLSEWTNGDYKSIQAYLMAEKGEQPEFGPYDDEEALTNHIEEIVAVADEAYRRMVPLGADVTLHRATDWLPFDPETVKVGARVRSSGYTATTTTENLSWIRLVGLGGSLATVRILAQKGSKRVLWDGSGGESEAVINRDSVFTVLDVRKKEGGAARWEVDLLLND